MSLSNKKQCFLILLNLYMIEKVKGWDYLSHVHYIILQRSCVLNVMNKFFASVIHLNSSTIISPCCGSIYDLSPNTI